MLYDSRMARSAWRELGGTRSTGRAPEQIEAALGDVEVVVALSPRQLLLAKLEDASVRGGTDHTSEKHVADRIKDAGDSLCIHDDPSPDRLSLFLIAGPWRS